jgi:PAS domain S-box-containing protein
VKGFCLFIFVNGITVYTGVKMFRNWKVVILFIAVLAIFSASSFYLLAAIKDKYVDLQQTTMETILSAATLGLNNWKKQVNSELSLWLNSPVISDFIEDEFKTNINYWLTNVTPYIVADDIYFSNKEGIVVSSTNDMIGKNIDFQLYSRSIKLQTDERNFIIREEIDGSGIYRLIITIPVLSFADEIVGYAHFELDLEKDFSAILASASFGETGRVIPISTSSDILNKTSFFSENSYRPPKYKESLNQITFNNRSDGYWVGLYKWVDDLGCWIHLEVQYQELFYMFEFIKNLILLFYFIVIFISLIIFLQSIYFSNKRDQTNLIYKNSFFDSLDIKLVSSFSGEIIDWSKASELNFGLIRGQKYTVSSIGIPSLVEHMRDTIKSYEKNTFDLYIKGIMYLGSVNVLENYKDKYLLFEFKDVSRQADFAKKIKVKEERLRTTMQATNQGYFDLNFKDGEEYFDVSLVEMLGYSSKSNVNRGVLDSLVHPDDFEKLIRMNNELFENNVNKLIRYEIRMKTRNHGWRYILIKSKVLERDDNGRALRVVGVHSDITQRIKSDFLIKKERLSILALNKQLNKSSKIKDDFISTMSHELRTPLNSIISLSDVMIESANQNLDDKQHQYLKVIQRSGIHLLDIINDILDISKINSGKMTLNMSNISVDGTIKDTIDIIHTLADKKSIKIKYANSMSTDIVEMDEKRFKQILLNLMSNSIKFTENGNSVGVNCSNTSNKFRVEIWDEGIGISDENLRKLFQPFIQVDSELSRSQDGTGLGLSLAKSMTELHGGELEVNSKEGAGSTFTVTFPLTLLKPTLPQDGGAVFI